MKKQQKIALIEDSQLIAKLIQFALEKEGHKVEVFSEVDIHLLKLLIRRKYKLFVIDLMLPKGLSGEELIDRIRRKKKTPILVVTAKSTDRTLQHVFELGADDFIAKPFSVVELKVRAKKLMGR